MKEDIVSLLREQERLLGKMCDNLHGWMDDLLREAFDLESFFRYAAALGFDQSHIRNSAGKQGNIDSYRILGLEKTATDQEVKKRYRELLIKLHPDTAGAEGTEFLLQMLIAAYQQIASERGWQ